MKKNKHSTHIYAESESFSSLNTYKILVTINSAPSRTNKLRDLPYYHRQANTKQSELQQVENTQKYAEVKSLSLSKIIAEMKQNVLRLLRSQGSSALSSYPLTQIFYPFIYVEVSIACTQRSIYPNIYRDLNFKSAISP